MPYYEYKDDSDRVPLDATTLEDALIEASSILREAIRGNADWLSPGDYDAKVIDRDDNDNVIESHTITETLPLTLTR